jgi:hypothetical protein
MGNRKQYFAIKNALSTEEKKLINFYEMQWHLRNGYVPTVGEVAKFLDKTETEVNFWLTRKPVQKALDARGITWRQHSQTELTATQVAAAVTLMNFADTRTREQKLDQLGINPATYYAWLNDPQFKTLVERLADQNLSNIRPAAIGEFTKKINQGDWGAIKYWFETTGELHQNDMPKSEVLLRMIVEIVQRHVKDPNTILAIAQDIKLAAANRTLEMSVEVSPHSITSSAVEDPELEEAKKKLGFA